MKSKSTRLILLVVIIVGVLAMLKYRPWQHTVTDVPTRTGMILDGGNITAVRELTGGFLPVTCHLTCPVTDFASKTTVSNTNFNSRLFTDFPTVTNALEAKQIQATFMLAPLAMKLREQCVP